MARFQPIDSSRIVRYRQSSQVNFIAKMMITLSAVQLLLGAYQFLQITLFNNLNQLQLFLKNAEVSLADEDVSVLMRLTSIVLIVFLVFNTVKLVVALFLLRRKNWARVLYSFYFLAAAIAEIIGMSVVFLSIQAGNHSLVEQQSIGLALQTIGYTVIAVLLVAFVFDVFSQLVLTSHTIAEEFD